MDRQHRPRVVIIILLILALLAVGLVAMRLYTLALVRRAEAAYPPAEFVEVGGVRLHYARAGQGRPVVFIHGGGGTLFEFTRSPVYDPAVDSYDAIFLDRPGMGYSERPSGQDMTPTLQARLIHEALAELGVERPVLVGQSWGGVIALAYALDYPQDVSAVVLLGSSPYPRDRGPEPFYARLIRVPVLGDVVLNTLYVPVGRHVVAPLFLREGAGYFAPLPEIPEEFSQIVLGPELRPSHALSDAEESLVIPASLPDLSHRLVGVEVPVIVVAGSLDEHALEQSARLERDLAYNEVRIIEGAGHYLWFATPDVVLEAIQAAWDRADEFDHLPGVPRARHK